MTTISAPTSRMLTVNGLELHHLDWGNADAPALVCVHGLRGNAHAFDGFARRFADRYHVISLDVRGRGDSAWSPDGKYQMSDYASDLARRRRSAWAPNVQLHWHVDGRTYWYDIRGDQGDRLTRFILNDIGPDGEAGSDRITREAGKAPDSFESYEEAVGYLRDTAGAASRMSEEALQERAKHTFKQRDDGRWIAKNDPEFLRQRAAAGTAHDPAVLWKALAELPCPALLLRGTVSDVLSEAQAQKIVQTLRNGTLAHVPDVGHTPTLDEPESVEALEKFLGNP